MKVLAEYRKSSSQLIRICLDEFKGSCFVNIREWRLYPGKDPCPTGRGITIAPEHIPTAIQALVLAKQHYDAKGQR